MAETLSREEIQYRWNSGIRSEAVYEQAARVPELERERDDWRSAAGAERDRAKEEAWKLRTELEAARELIERERVFRQLIGDALKRGEAVPWAIACVDLSPPTEEDARRGRELAAQHGWGKHLDFAYDASRAKEPGQEMNPRDCTCEHVHRSSHNCPSKAPSRGAIPDRAKEE